MVGSVLLLLLVLVTTLFMLPKLVVWINNYGVKTSKRVRKNLKK